jgi:hypothetical protein
LTAVNFVTKDTESVTAVTSHGRAEDIETFVPPMVAAGRGGHLVNVSSAAGLVALPWHAAYSASKFGLRGLSEVLRFDLARHRIGVSLVVPGAVNTPLVNTVEIAGVDREDPRVARWVNRFTGHAVSPETAARKILTVVARNRYLIYTSGDIRALYAFKRLAWWPYSVAMRQVNVIFTRVLRPSPPTRQAVQRPAEEVGHRCQPLLARRRQSGEADSRRAPDFAALPPGPGNWSDGPAKSMYSAQLASITFRTACAPRFPTRHPGSAACAPPR